MDKTRRRYFSLKEMGKGVGKEVGLILTALGAVLAGTSCAKIQYLGEQGIGQLTLLTRSRDNQKVLADVRVDKSHKQKIKKIIAYKKYFYDYWERPPTRIYDRTTFLDSPAVTYLVVASPHNRVQAKEEFFPFFGRFPYLGFFKEQSARQYQEALQEEGYITWQRPVYAYSTLGYFNDTILSSFFRFDDEALADLIFHEFFHTIFFIKDEIELNEALAVYFAQEMLFDYFRDDLARVSKLQRHKEQQHILSGHLADLAHALDQLYQQKLPQTRQESEELRQKFLKETFWKTIEEACGKVGLAKSDCWPLQRDWNNASLAAFLTYKKKTRSIVHLRQRREREQGKKGAGAGGLKEFLAYIEQTYEDFKKREVEGTFSDHLFRDIRDIEVPDIGIGKGKGS